MDFVNSKGVDISYANGNIDLAKVKKAGYQWVMIRCGHGSDIPDQDDKQFVANVAKAEKLGMPWGAYLFSYACSTADAKSELAHIDRLLKEQRAKGYYPSLPIALDIEPSSYVQNKGAWTKSNLTNVATIVLDGLAKLGYYPMIYTGYYELDNMLSDHIRTDVDCWFSQWNSEPNAYGYNRLGIWQYGGETNLIESNSINGVGTIDKNYAYKDYPSIIKSGGYNGFKKSDSTPDAKPALSTIDNSGKTKPDMVYRVRTKNSGWLPAVKNFEDYAGIENDPITGFAIKATKGSVWYQAHTKGGKWLSKVTGYDTNDYSNGYAGLDNGTEIDAIRVYYTTPDDIRNTGTVYEAKYRVSPVGSTDYYDYQYDTIVSNTMDGYAGLFGKSIDKLQLILE